MSTEGPLVTGISPKEGPPGTKVTIRGERLGKAQSDLVGLEICGVDCFLTAEWISSNKILARTLLCKTKGDIIVETKSGGKGASTVQFKGFIETNIGPTKESAVWVEEIVNTGHRPLSISVQQEDPLQISVEGNEKKYPVEELLEMFPDSNGNLRCENFSPLWFLLENHHATGFEDLKSGLHFLNRKVHSQTEGKLNFLKENINSVMEQLDAIINLKRKFEKYNEAHGDAYIAQLDDAIGVCEREANKLFQDVLSRKDRADVTRNALSGYQRFKFLFSLPGTLEKSIEKEEFDIAINDYARASHLFDQPDTDRPIFKKFQREVDTRVEKLRQKLKGKLTDSPFDIEAQRRIIQYLVALNADYDAGWICLQNQYEYISKCMKMCFNQFSSGDRNKDITTSTGKCKVQASDPLEVQFLNCLSGIFLTHFPEFWQFSQDYFSYKLAVKPDMEKQNKVKEMMISTFSLYSELVRACLLPSEFRTSEFVWKEKSPDSLNNWVQHCLNDIRDTYSEFLILDLPKDMMEIFAQLIFQIRKSSLEIMIHQMSDEIVNLYKKEEWICEPSEGRGFITSLPAMYENVVISACKVIKEVLMAKSTEEAPLLKNEIVAKKTKENMTAALSSFADTLELLISKSSNASEGLTLSSNTQRGLPSTQTAYLLLIINNCSYTTEVILPQLSNSLEKLGFPSMASIITKTEDALSGVKNLTFAKFTEMKYEPVVGQIEQSMYSGRFDWEKCSEPKNVRPYITKTLLAMISIISEVTAISKKLISTVMIQVTENVCEELTRLFSCVPKFSQYGSLQATLDVTVFQSIVTDFLSTNSKSLLKEIFNLIPDSSFILKTVELKKLEEVHRRRTELQYSCCRTQENYI